MTPDALLEDLEHRKNLAGELARYADGRQCLGLGTALAVSSFERPAYWCVGYLAASALSLVAATLRLLVLAESIDYLLLFKQELRDGEQRLISFRPATDPME